jgi:hypothetical protein
MTISIFFIFEQPDAEFITLSLNFFQQGKWGELKMTMNQLFESN